jgi:molybdopterin biosynthesis enzyme
MDGIAIRASSGKHAAAARFTGPAPVVPDTLADAGGTWQLPASSFTWVDTGDPMPADTDTVVERERVQPRADGSAEITGPAPRGRDH